MLFVCHPKILNMQCLQFPLGPQTKSIMVCYGIFWGVQYLFAPKWPGFEQYGYLKIRLDTLCLLHNLT